MEIPGIFDGIALGLFAKVVSAIGLCEGEAAWKPTVRIIRGWLSPMMFSTTKMENAAMFSAEIAKDARAEVRSVGTRSVLRTGATTKSRSARDELGASILTYDLEAVAGRYRAKAVKRLARTLFRNLARRETRQRENVSDAVAWPSEAVLSRPIAWLGTSTDTLRMKIWF